MKTTTQQIKEIFSSKYHPHCHPSREENIKMEEAILVLADKIDFLISKL
jgi:hypothetical protein